MSRGRLADEVANELRARIYNGRYRSGQRLLQEQLAEELDISRTPLREALRVLEKEGLVSVLAKGGVQVVKADTDQWLAAFELREVIDGLATRLATQRGSFHFKTQIQAMLSTQRSVLQAWNPSDWTEANVAFHRLIVEAAANEYVTAQLPLVRLTAQVFVLSSVVEPSRAETALQDHETIVEAITAGDPLSAESAARTHIRRTIQGIRNQPGLERIAGID